ncbi:hypothetical protein ACVWXN_004422 [Bradyrhizobium sp. i1.4.4]
MTRVCPRAPRVRARSGGESRAGAFGWSARAPARRSADVHRREPLGARAWHCLLLGDHGIDGIADRRPLFARRARTGTGLQPARRRRPARQLQGRLLEARPRARLHHDPRPRGRRRNGDRSAAMAAQSVLRDAARVGLCIQHGRPVVVRAEDRRRAVYGDDPIRTRPTRCGRGSAWRCCVGPARSL